MTSVKFGLNEGLNFNTNSANISAFYPINYHEYLATTRNGLFRFEDENIKKIYPHKLATSVIIPEYQFIVGISSIGGEISVMMIDDLDKPVFSHFKTDQLNIFHIIYSHKSHTLITVGSGIKIWNFDVKMPRKVTLINKPEITITLRAQIAPEYDTPILNPPSIDYEQELLLLPKMNGFCGYNFDGKEKKYFSKIEATAQTAASLCNENKKFLTAQQGDGFHLWSQKGYIVKKIPGGMSSVLALRYINKHFALFLDSNLYIFIIDIKTNNFFHCYTLNSKPNYLNIYHDSINHKYFLVISQGSLVKKLEIVLPWTVWKKMTTQVNSIRRCPKFNEAARILAYFKSSIFSFLSPKDGKNLTSAVDTQPSGPIFHLYDRGLLLEPIFDETNSYVDHTNVIEISKENKRDALFVTTAESNTSLFTTGDNPCKLAKLIEIQVTSITVCEVNGTFMYCFSNSQGELLFYNYSDFSRVSRKLILKKPIKKVFYHRKSESLLIVFENEVHRFELNGFKDVQKISIKDGSYSEFYGNLLLIGCKNGNIESLRIVLDKRTNNYSLIQITDDCIHYHDDKITSFAFAPTFFISSSMDKTLKVWNYNFNLLYDIIFPFPLFSCEILNADHDLLVGTDNEILKIKGSSLFGEEEIDPEISEIDNYDRISDELTNQLIFFATEKNKEEQSDFLSERMKNKEDKSQRGMMQTKIPRRKIANYNVISQDDENKPTQEKNKNAAPAELSEDERNRRLYEMNLINERSDKEKMQAKLRAEMKMKMEEEERKRKLKEAEEEAKRKELEEKQKEEEEEEKGEEKEKKRRRRKINRSQKVQNEQTANINTNNKQEDDLDDFLFKQKQKEKLDENNQNQFRREKTKTVYQPKQSAPRPSRPFRTNAKSQEEKETKEENKNDYDNEYDEEEANENNDDSESSLKVSKGRRKKDGAKDEQGNKNHNKKKDSKIPTKSKNKKNGRGNENEEKIYDENGNEIINNEDEKEKESKIYNENGNEIINNEDEKEKSSKTFDENVNEIINNEDEREKETKIFDENGNEIINKDWNEKESNEFTTSQKENEDKVERENTNNEEIKSQSSEPQRSEIDTQTSFPLNNEKDKKKGISESKSEMIIQKRGINQTILHEETAHDRPSNDDNEKPTNAHTNKKRSFKPQKSTKLKSNTAELSKTTTSIITKNKIKTNNNNINNNNINNADENDVGKVKASSMRKRKRQDQIFLTKNIKRSPTPPPLRKKVFCAKTSSARKTINPSKSFLRFRSRFRLRRCRTPPVLQQEKLVVLPGPEIVLDREVIIDKILDGEVELMPLLRWMNSNNRTVFIQKLKGNENRKSGNDESAQNQFSRMQTNFQNMDDDDEQKEKKVENKGNNNGCLINIRSMQTRSNLGNDQRKKSENISVQSSYPPLNQPSSKFAPVLPNNLNLNSSSNHLNSYRQIISQKVENDGIICLGEDDPEQIIQNDDVPLYGINALNRYNISNKLSNQTKKKKQKQISILNLGLDVQETVRPLNLIRKNEITIPRAQKPSNSYAHSPRRNLQNQRKLPLFNIGSEYRSPNTKNTDNNAQAYDTPTTQYDQREKNKYKKKLVEQIRSSSPPTLYKPRILEKNRNNFRSPRYFK